MLYYISISAVDTEKAFVDLGPEVGMAQFTVTVRRSALAFNTRWSASLSSRSRFRKEGSAHC